VKLEVLPIEFFHELVRQLPGLVTLTTIAAGAASSRSTGG